MKKRNIIIMLVFFICCAIVVLIMKNASLKKSSNVNYMEHEKVNDFDEINNIIESDKGVFLIENTEK